MLSETSQVTKEEILYDLTNRANFKSSQILRSRVKIWNQGLRPMGQYVATVQWVQSFSFCKMRNSESGW